MTLIELCKKIELQEELTQMVLECAETLDFALLSQHIEDLTVPELSENAFKSLGEKLGEDPCGAKMLTCYLKAALITRQKYKELGIDESIYVDTMKCFTRFCGECLERKDYLAFELGFWSYRHLNTNLMRIGTLEYEQLIRNGSLFISVHIPSDADLSAESLDYSFKTARALLNEKFPACRTAPIYCESWLLSGELRDLLPVGSKILGFQSYFDIQRQNPVSKGALQYIFHRADCSDYNALPENTSLQRKVKALLLDGGGIGTAYGVLKEDEPKK